MNMSDFSRREFMRRTALATAGMAALPLAQTAARAQGTGDAVAGGLNLLVAGDIHYDLLGDHDMDWLSTKPDDLRQVTQEYTVFTEKFFEPFMDVLKRQAVSARPPVGALIQLGDLQEGLAGSPEKARQMTQHTLEAVGKFGPDVPWVLVKGNHDITGPGAVEAYDELVIPWLKKELSPAIDRAHYVYDIGDTRIVVLDIYNRDVDFVDFLEDALEGCKARHKLVALHEPVIPVTYRCWHVLRQPAQSAARERLLGLLASHQAIVLCGHLHHYSVVRRVTPQGPIVQVMVGSVIREADRTDPYYTKTEYGPALLEGRDDWDPKTMAKRRAMLAEEARFVTDYRLADLPGYAMLTLGGTGDDEAMLRYYPALATQPYDTVDLAALHKPAAASA